MKLILKIILGMSPVFLLTPQAYSIERQENLEKVLQNLSAYSEYQAQFNQELYSALRDKVTKSSGVIQIKSPCCFRFEVQQPQAKLFVNNGIEFWEYNPEMKHAQQLNSKSVSFDYLKFLTNPGLLKKSYTILPWKFLQPTLGNQTIDLQLAEFESPPAENADKVSIKLVPKEDNQQKVLYAIVNVRKGFLEELRIVQKNENRVRLVFSNLKHEKLNAKTFSFIPDAGIVVDKN